LHENTSLPFETARGLKLNPDAGFSRGDYTSRLRLAADEIRVGMSELIDRRTILTHY